MPCGMVNLNAALTSGADEEGKATMADDMRYIGTASDGARLYVTRPGERVTIDLAVPFPDAPPAVAVLGQPGTGKGMVRP